MRRNFGLSFNTAQRALQRLQYGLSKRAAEPAPVIRIRIVYFGREVFFHGPDIRTLNSNKSHLNQGSSQ